MFYYDAVTCEEDINSQFVKDLFGLSLPKERADNDHDKKHSGEKSKVGHIFSFNSRAEHHLLGLLTVNNLNTIIHSQCSGKSAMG